MEGGVREEGGKRGGLRSFPNGTDTEGLSRGVAFRALHEASTSPEAGGAGRRRPDPERKSDEFRGRDLTFETGLLADDVPMQRHDPSSFHHRGW